MLRVNGLFGHIQRNNFKTLILIGAFLLLAVGGTVGPLQLMLHGSGASQGGKNWEIIRQSIEQPVFKYGAGAGFSQVRPSARPTTAAPRDGQTGPPKAPAADAPLDLSQVPAINRPGIYFLFASPAEQALWALGFALLYLVGATWWNTQFIRYAVRAKPLRRDANPELYNLVENLAISVGIPCPAIEVVQSSQLNAYASGLTPSTARLGFTTGLLARLNPREIEAVAAHELTHILYRDSRLMAVTKACVDLVVIAPMRYARRIWQRPVAVLPILVMLATGVMNPLFYLALLGVVTGSVILAFLCKALVMQSREFVADAGAIEMTKSPGALISALCKVAGDEYQAEGSPFAQAMMILGPTAGWFSTHPSLEARIAAIRRFGGVVADAHVGERAPPPARAEATLEPAGPRVRRVAGLAGFDASLLPSVEEIRERQSKSAAFSVLPTLPERFAPLHTPNLRASTIRRDAPPLRVSPWEPLASGPDESWFERWVISGRLNRIVAQVSGAMKSGRRGVAYVYGAAMLFGFVVVWLPRSFH